MQCPAGLQNLLQHSHPTEWRFFMGEGDSSPGRFTHFARCSLLLPPRARLQFPHSLTKGKGSLCSAAHALATACTSHGNGVGLCVATASTRLGGDAVCAPATSHTTAKAKQGFQERAILCATTITSH